MGRKHPETLRERQGYFNGVADEIVDMLEAQGAIVIVQDQNGAIGMNSRGVNHAKAVELLSVGIHMVLSQHDRLVTAGAAGDEAQKRAAAIEAEKAAGAVGEALKAAQRLVAGLRGNVPLEDLRAEADAAAGLIIAALVSTREAA